MKILLAISLVTNIVLGYVLISRKPEKEVVERLIIETHPKTSQAEESSVTTKAAAPAVKPVAKGKEEKKKQVDPPEFVNMDSYELQDAGEKMESDRMDFLTVQLGLSQEKISEHNRIRDQFYKESSKFWQKNPMRELSFKERREMLEMEEEFHSKLEKLYGKENWKRYQKYREDYNSKGYQKQMEDGQPFIFMGL
ncbi:MAG: hypothetical protein ACLGHN_06915 [Bacteriovoracia bacterium]